LLIAFEAHILKRSVVALHRVDPRSRLRVRDRTPIEHGRLSRQLDEGGRRSDSFEHAQQCGQPQAAASSAIGIVITPRSMTKANALSREKTRVTLLSVM
jgi:hypothetical protein